MTVPEVKNRATVTGAIEIGRHPGVVHVTFRAPVDRLEERGLLCYAQRAVRRIGPAAMTKRVLRRRRCGAADVPVAAAARVIQAETILPPGQSGHVPQTGTEPAPGGPAGLFESFAFKSGGFDQPGTTESPPAARRSRATATACRTCARATTATCGSASATRWRRTGSCSSSCSAAPPRGGWPRCSAPARLHDDVVARRDYYRCPSCGACSAGCRRTCAPASTPTRRA